MVLLLASYWATQAPGTTGDERNDGADDESGEAQHEDGEQRRACHQTSDLMTDDNRSKTKKTTKKKLKNRRKTKNNDDEGQPEKVPATTAVELERQRQMTRVIE